MREGVADWLDEGAVAVAVDRGVLKEGVLGDEFVEPLLREKMVVDAVLLLAARFARRAGNGVDKLRVVLEQSVAKG